MSAGHTPRHRTQECSNPSEDSMRPVVDNVDEIKQAVKDLDHYKEDKIKADSEEG